MKDCVYEGFWIKVGLNLIVLIILLFLFSALSASFIFICSYMFSGFILILL